MNECPAFLIAQQMRETQLDWTEMTGKHASTHNVVQNIGEKGVNLIKAFHICRFPQLFFLWKKFERRTLQASVDIALNHIIQVSQKSSDHVSSAAVSWLVL